MTRTNTHPVVHRRGAFTLLEMLITIGVIAVAALSIAPTLADDTRLRLLAASRVLASDIELAQVMTISYPNQAVVVRFDINTQTYWLAYTSDPETPILRTDTGEPYIVTIGQGRTSSANGVRMRLVNLPSAALEFNPQGGLIDFTSSPRISLSNDGRFLNLDIEASTGSISETDA